MKTIKNIFMCTLLILSALATQGCDELKENWRQSWATRYLPGVWVMTSQKFYYYDSEGNIKETVSDNYSIFAGTHPSQKRIVVDREDGDEFYFSVSYAHRGEWVPEAEYHVLVEENGDMYRTIGSIAGGNQEEYIGTIHKLKMFKMEMTYDAPDYSVETTYVKSVE